MKLWRYITGLFLWPKMERDLRDRIKNLGSDLYSARSENNNLQGEIFRLKKLILEKQVIYVHRPVVTVLAGPKRFEKVEGFAPLPRIDKHFQVDCVPSKLKQGTVTIYLDISLRADQYWFISDIYFDELSELLKQHFRDSGH